MNDVDIEHCRYVISNPHRRAAIRANVYFFSGLCANIDILSKLPSFTMDGMKIAKLRFHDGELEFTIGQRISRRASCFVYVPLEAILLFVLRLALVSGVFHQTKVETRV